MDTSCVRGSGCVWAPKGGMAALHSSLNDRPHLRDVVHNDVGEGIWHGDVRQHAVAVVGSQHRRVKGVGCSRGGCACVSKR